MTDTVFVSQQDLRATSSNALFPSIAGMAFAWSGVVIMWMFWVSFIVFLVNPAQLAAVWPLPMIDRGDLVHPAAAAAIDCFLISLFGLQHSVMARPWFKQLWAHRPPAFERCTFVHMANLALFALIIFWQPIPFELWSIPRGIFHDAIWVIFATGWLILFAGAWSFGILDLLGVERMQAWVTGQTATQRLKTGMLYRWLRHPMYVGVLIGVWATPRMTVGHLLLASGFTLYVFIGACATRSATSRGPMDKTIGAGERGRERARAIHSFPGMRPTPSR